MMPSPAIAAAIGAAFRCIVPVRWGDLDAQNHVNNTVFFRYFEEARIQLFRQAGFVMPSNKIGALAHTRCDFLKPMVYPATVIVVLVLTRVGTSSMSFDTFIECQGEPGVIYARGQDVMVGTDAKTGRAVPWTAAELDAFRACLTK